jgi:response regulator RpfG family c-di-GMP phosphodiesterase
MSEAILFVDDEPNVLEGYRRNLGGKYTVSFAQGGAEALAEIDSHGTFAVVVTDMNMDGMNGIEFLKQVQQKTPDSVRLMLTGANLESAVAAVNEGRIFRFLTKPCSSDTLRQAVDAALEQYRLVTAERTVLSTTLLGAIKILVDTLSAIRPVAFGRATRVRNLVHRLAPELLSGQVWQAEVAALLSQVGCVFLAEETLRKAYAGAHLNPRELDAFQSHPAAGKGFDGSGFPDNGRSGEALPIESRILKVALDYDSLLSTGRSAPEALQTLYSRGGRYDRKVVDTLRTSLAREAARSLLAVAEA